MVVEFNCLMTLRSCLQTGKRRGGDGGVRLIVACPVWRRMAVHAHAQGFSRKRFSRKGSTMIDWSESLRPLNLAAVVYRPADDVDSLLARFADGLIGKGHRLGGVVQRNTKDDRGQRERMEVIDLMTGRAVRICQFLGDGAAACRLNPAGLAEAATAVTRAVAADVELVIVNKFSKQEASGHGLRAEIADAVMAGFPLLTAVSDNCYEAWKSFTGGFGTTLLCERRIVEDWWQEMSVRAARARVTAELRGSSCTPLRRPLLSFSDHHIG
jgi:nucleoside-triphosphatase THEP1